MKTVSMVEAKKKFSALVERVASGEQCEITITCHGVPAVRLVAVPASKSGKRIGVAKGRFHMPVETSTSAEEAATSFTTTGATAPR